MSICQRLCVYERVGPMMCVCVVGGCTQVVGSSSWHMHIEVLMCTCARCKPGVCRNMGAQVKRSVGER